jgi:hypothetical protein
MQEIILTESQMQYSRFSEPVQLLVDDVPRVIDHLPIDDIHDFNIDSSKPVNCAVTFLMEHEGYTREQALTLVENFINRG